MKVDLDKTIGQLSREWNLGSESVTSIIHLFSVKIIPEDYDPTIHELIAVPKED